MNQRAHIESLHALYVSLTGQQIFLNPARERDWFEWLRFRNPAFTAQDLRDVIAHLRRGIHDQRRNPGSLKFSNLIGQPDYFEEDLAEARALSRPKPPTTRTVPLAPQGGEGRGEGERIIKTTGTADTSRAVGEILNESLRKLKQAAE